MKLRLLIRRPSWTRHYRLSFSLYIAAVLLAFLLTVLKDVLDQLNVEQIRTRQMGGLEERFDEVSR